MYGMHCVSAKSEADQANMWLYLMPLSSQMAQIFSVATYMLDMMYANEPLSARPYHLYDTARMLTFSAKNCIWVIVATACRPLIVSLFALLQ